MTAAAEIGDRLSTDVTKLIEPEASGLLQFRLIFDEATDADNNVDAFITERDSIRLSLDYLTP